MDRADFNSYGSRRGNHEVMIRGTFANIRLRNQLAPGTEGGLTRDFSQDDGPVTTIFEAAEHYAAAGTPLVVLAGKEYGSGSSRDWAAKGTALLGVRAVIAESYERIHRSNLIGMGVLPLQFPDGETAESLGLTGEEVFAVTGITALNEGQTPRTVHGHGRRCRVRGPGPHRHPRRGRLLPPRRDHALRAPLAPKLRSDRARLCAGSVTSWCQPGYRCESWDKFARTTFEGRAPLGWAALPTRKACPHAQKRTMHRCGRGRGGRGDRRLFVQQEVEHWQYRFSQR